MKLGLIKKLAWCILLILNVVFSWGQNVSSALQQITPSYSAGLMGVANPDSSLPVAVSEVGIQQNAAPVSDGVNSQLLPPSNQHLPYPVIFIHGLNSDFSVWHDQRDALMNGLAGLSFGGYYNYCLNYDGNNSTANKLVYPTPGADIRYFNLENPIAADYYIVNFDIDNFGRPRYNTNFTDVLSNEAAIAKQGVALNRIISMVLNLTGRDKVVLMGHSMGGLAAREYVQNPSNWQPDGQHHVAKLVTTGTPHGGYEGINFPLTEIDWQSEAYRDLKSDYYVSGYNGVYLFGGNENYFVINNNYLYDFYNVDVNCNGIDADGTDVIGLNEKPWWTDLDYSYIIGDCIGCPSQGLYYGDGVVQMVNANLSNFTNGLPAAKNEFIYTAASTMLHTVLPEVISENMKGLDEPNEFNLSYGIELNTEYTAFLTKPSTLGYDFDYDDFVFNMPINATLIINMVSEYPVSIPFRIYNESLNVIYYGNLNASSSLSFTFPQLTSGNYFLEYYLHENYIGDNSYLYPYKFELQIAPVESSFSTATSATICAGECISFADNTSNSPNSWNWTFTGADNTTSNQQNPSNVCYNTPGTYSVSLTTSNGYSTDNTTIAGYVTVLAQPSPVITQNANTMSSSSSTGNQWYLNNTPIAGATGQTFSPTASGTYYVQVTNSNGCSENSAPFNFIYTPAPVAQFQANLNQVCAGDCIVFTDNSSNQPTDWSWVFQGGTPSSSSSQTPSSICYQIPGTYFVSLTVSNAGGSDVHTSSGYITVIATPSIPTISGNGNQLTSSASQGNQWYLNNTPISGATGQAYSPTASGTYYVQVTNSNGCSEMSQPFGFVYTNAPFAAFSTQNNDQALCVGECINFLDQSANAPTSWQWSFPGGTPSSSTAQNPTFICYNNSGIYQVALTVSNAGGSDAITTNAYITVVNDPQTPIISVDGNVLTSSSNSGNQWYLNGAAITGAIGQTYLANQSGNYSVTVTNANDCSSSSTPVNLTVTDIEEVNSELESLLYPNPSSGIVMVKSADRFHLIEVFDLSGKLLLSTTDQQFDLSPFAEGVYVVRLHGVSAVINQKLIKTK